ncbi:MAG TPA: XdhC family protein [Terracidiphilus sp.]|jgi:xanthine/CO dehydrogenase XdhC/CoxF family maturation factor|nr:XdhC family protein [Terracidiphilus sp.]
MNDLGQILSLWRELQNAGTDYVLATVIAVEGSSYRKPGACMLLAQDGRRAGTVSGGCLEAEVNRRAWWLTSSGPVVERYSTQEEDDERPYGSGCGGVIYLLLERAETAGRLLQQLDRAFYERVPVAVATVLDGSHLGSRRTVGDRNAEQQIDGCHSSDALAIELERLAQEALEQRSTFERTLALESGPTRVMADYRSARPGLWIFGAGDDAKPLAQFAQSLGWFVAIADGRSHLATRDRFPAADEVRVLPICDLPTAAPQHFALRPTDAAVVMTHSYDQDARILSSLFVSQPLPAYMGVLGPQRRTRELLGEAARLLGISSATSQAEKWLEYLRAPTGLDLGADTPATIALSIIAEIQQVLTAATAQPLRTVRASREVAAGY